MSEPWSIPVENSWTAAVKEETPTEQKKGVLPWLAEIANSWFPSGQKPVAKLPSADPPKTTQDRFETVFSRLIQAESRGKHTAASGGLTTSPVGAQGITQLMPKTAANPGFGIEPVNDQSEAEYLRVGRSYLQAMLKSFDGDYEKALAAYNAGSRNVRTAITKATKAGDASKWREYLPKKQETNPYIDKIMKGL